MPAAKDFSIRSARPEDTAILLRLIRDLAVYEKLEHEVEATEETLRQRLFGEGLAEALLAFVGDEPAGMAVFFFTFSTFTATPVLYLEDVFVRPDFRRMGIATAFFGELRAAATRRSCRRMEWSVLDWNESASAFYARIGAKHLPEWHKFRITLPVISNAS